MNFLKSPAVWVLVAGVLVEMYDTGTATTSSGTANPLYSIDSKLPFGLSVGLLLILAGGGMLMFGKGV